MKLAIAEILLNEGYIKKFEVIEDGNFKTIHATLKYGKDKNEKIITGLKRISKPGRRIYSSIKDLPLIKNGLGINILSTDRGLMSDAQARKQSLGGEVICSVF